MSPGAYILFLATTGILLFSRPHRGKVNRYDLALALTVGLNMFSSWHSYVCVEIIRKPTYFLFNVFRGQSQSRTHFISGANFRLATLRQRFALKDLNARLCWQLLLGTGNAIPVTKFGAIASFRTRTRITNNTPIYI